MNQPNCRENALSIKERAARYSDDIIADRRYFHAHPEISFQEKETTQAIAQRLERMGIPVQTFPDYYGLVGEIRGGTPGATVMLRADIDALPVEEKTGLPFAAANGCMHACGHDCHTAMLLGAAKILTDMRDVLPGTVKLLFQSAEESSHGAEYYVRNSALDHVDAIMGMHIWSGLDSPFFSIEHGVRMASCDNFTIEVKGVSAHGSAPHLGRDAIIAASAIVANLQTIASRRADPLDPIALTIGVIRGGQRFNIIANHVTMEGTVRTYSRDLRARLEEEIRGIVRHTAEAHGCTAKVEYQPRVGPVDNDSPELVRIAREAAESMYGAESLQSMPRTMASEDFFLLQEKVPGIYVFLGSRNAGKGLVYPNHNDKYDVDEGALHKGSALYARFAADFLENNAACTS